MIEGSSAWCPTFDNEVLCGLSEEVTPRSELVPVSGSVSGGRSTVDEKSNGNGQAHGHGHGQVKDVKFECVGAELWAIGMGG